MLPGFDGDEVKPERCKGCPLYDAPGPVFGVGPEDAKIMLVGEAPGGEEVVAKVPFVGPAGRVLGVAAHAAGLDRAACYTTNAVKCLPPKRGDSHRPTADEIRYCRAAWLEEEIAKVKPTVIVAIGGTALESFVGEEREITKWRGAVLQL